MCVYVCVYVCVYTYILPTKITLLFSRMGFCSEKKMHSRWLSHFQGSYPWPSCCPLKFNIFKLLPLLFILIMFLMIWTSNLSRIHPCMKFRIILFPSILQTICAKYLSDPLIKSCFSIHTACSLNQSFNPSSPFSDLLRAAEPIFLHRVFSYSTQSSHFYQIKFFKTKI